MLASSSVFLATNCTVNGVTGPATVSGNPITSTGGNPQGLTQTFNFNTDPKNTVGFVYDIAPASGTITGNANGAIPQTADLPVDPTIFQPNYVAGTSFATSNCLAHSGELLPSGNPACKLYTLLCTTGTGAEATGAQCPVSSVANEVVKDIFDGPQFTLQNIYAGGDVFHEGIGLLMASDTWPSSPVARARSTCIQVCNLCHARRTCSRVSLDLADLAALDNDEPQLHVHQHLWSTTGQDLGLSGRPMAG